MNENYLYHRIAVAIRQEILIEKLKPGDHLPSVRQMSERWGCTIGTVQRAYQELAQQGLITRRAGRGTTVTRGLTPENQTPMRRAILNHRAEAFLLEVLTSGYTTLEVEAAMQMALEHWRVEKKTTPPVKDATLRFAGSHDLIVTWMAGHFSEIGPGYSLQVQYNGSLGGLTALAEGSADIAGCHLWDEESRTANEPYVRRLLPGQKVLLLTVAHRRLGLILPAGNPLDIYDLTDLARPGIRFINRQRGSGTRVWLDNALRTAKIDPKDILGYENEKITHTDVALAVAEGKADVGLGLEAAALAYGLNFTMLLRERYDLVIPMSSMELDAIKILRVWLTGPTARLQIAAFAGYDTTETGNSHWIG